MSAAAPSRGDLSSPCTALQGLAGSLDYTQLKTAILPRVYAACMRTTVANVRVQVRPVACDSVRHRTILTYATLMRLMRALPDQALALMSSTVQRMDRDESERMVDAAAQVRGRGGGPPAAPDVC
jgi:hypothetical protein